MATSKKHPSKLRLVKHTGPEKYTRLHLPLDKFIKFAELAARKKISKTRLLQLIVLEYLDLFGDFP